MSYGHNGGPPLTGGMGFNGWVAIARDIRKHPIVGFGSLGPYSKSEAFLDLVMECHWRPGFVMNGGRKMEIKPGQLVGAISWLAERWRWSPKETRTFLDKLEGDAMIDRETPGTMTGPDYSSTGSELGKQKGKQATVITLCNYGLYQMLPEQQGQANWLAEGKQGASKGQARGNIYKEEQSNKVTREQEIGSTGADAAGSEPKPETADGQTKVVPANDETPQGALPLPIDERLLRLSPSELDNLLKHIEAAERRRKAKEDKISKAVRKVADHEAQLVEALEIYNKAAKHFKFSECEAFTPARRARLLDRLADIGGVEAFRRALWAIRKDEFYLGKCPPSKLGQAPFRMDFDRLLSTDRGLGDVLAKLLDLSASDVGDDPTPGPNGNRWGWWRDQEEKWARLPADWWRGQLDEIKPNGTWPWWVLGPPPGHKEAVIHPDVVAERGLVEIYRGQINHEQ